MLREQPASGYQVNLSVTNKYAAKFGMEEGVQSSSALTQTAALRHQQ